MEGVLYCDKRGYTSNLKRDKEKRPQVILCNVLLGSIVASKIPRSRQNTWLGGQLWGTDWSMYSREKLTLWLYSVVAVRRPYVGRGDSIREK